MQLEIKIIFKIILCVSYDHENNVYLASICWYMKKNGRALWRVNVVAVKFSSRWWKNRFLYMRAIARTANARVVRHMHWTGWSKRNTSIFYPVNPKVPRWQQAVVRGKQFTDARHARLVCGVSMPPRVINSSSSTSLRSLIFKIEILFIYQIPMIDCFFNWCERAIFLRRRWTCAIL